MGQVIDDFTDAALSKMRAAFGIPTLRRVTAAFAATAAGDYAALDVISQSATNNVGQALKLPGMALNPGDVVTVYKVVLRSDDNSLLARTRIHVFDRPLLAADAELDDNAAFSITTFNGLRAKLGIIDIPALAPSGGGAFAAASQQREEFRTRADANAEGSLFVVVQLLDAEANEATGMLLEFDFYVA